MHRRFRFSLEPVLTVRQADRDGRRSALADAARRLQTLHAQLDDVRRTLAALRQHTRGSLASGTIDLPRLQSWHGYDTVLREQLGTLQSEAVRAGEEVERQRQAVAEADRQVRELEKLRERQHERWKVALARNRDFGDK